MSITLNKRWRWWLSGLALSLVLAASSYFTSPQQTAHTNNMSTDGVHHAGVHPRAKDTAQQVIALNQLKQTRTVTDSSELFRPKSWYIPPPPPPAPPPPVATAPPLPFSFLGKVQKPGGKVTIFLSDKDRVYLVHGGETLGDSYRVDGIEHGKLALTYLPLKKKQYLNLVETH